MKQITDIEKLATIYIISKGRPWCKTAETLTEIKYPGAWFIVCGNNDETLPEYIKNWGKDRVLVFDWYEQVKHTDVLDNFGFESQPSGAAPVRNAVFDFSRARGELRHWQLDDDFSGFRLTDTKLKKCLKLDGPMLYWWMGRIAKFAHEAKLANIGLCLSMSQWPINALEFYSRIYGSHNMSNDPAITPEWKGRLNDDTIHAISVYHNGLQKEMQVKFLGVNTPKTQVSKGGLTDMYQNLGTLRKTAYLFLVAPNAVRLAVRFGRYHHVIRWDKLVVKTLDTKWRKG